MAQKTFLPHLLGGLSTLLYAAAYSPLIDLNFASLAHGIGFLGFVSWVLSEPRAWWLLHGLGFASLFWLLYPLHHMLGLPLWLAAVLILIVLGVMTVLKAAPMVLFMRRLSHPWGFYACGLYWIFFEKLQVFWGIPLGLWSQAEGYTWWLPGFLPPLYAVLFIMILWERLGNKRMLGFLLLAFGVSALETKTSFPKMKIALVQAHIDKTDVLSASFSERQKLLIQHVSQYQNLTRQIADRVDLVVWPECILGSVMPLSMPQALDQISNLKMPLLTGISLNHPDYFNAAWLYESETSWQLRGKKHFVPFGEHTPNWILPFLRLWIHFPLESMQSPADYQVFSLHTLQHTFRFLAVICYELAFLPLEKLPKRLDWIVALSESIWFNSSWQDHQHLQWAQLAARTHKIPVLINNNTGSSAWIDANGKCRARMPRNTQGVLLINEQQATVHLDDASERKPR